MQITPRAGDLAIGTLLLAVAAFFIWGALHMPAGTFAVPGPAIVPLIFGSLLAITGAVLVVKALVSHAATPAPPIAFGAAAVIFICGAIMAVAIALEPAGFVVTIGVFLFAMLRMFSPLRTLRATLLAAAITFVTYWFFAHLLGVNLPRGIWLQWM